MSSRVLDTPRQHEELQTSLPVRVYVPSYWTFAAAGADYEDEVWSYEEPLREAAEIAGLVSFFNEKVDIVVDGERRERPRTEWS